MRAVRGALVALTLAGCAAGSPPPPPAPPPTAGRVAVPVGRGASAATLAGDLRVPGGQGAAPAVVLMHGCSGVSRNVREWAAEMRGWGYVTLVLDSFGGRGIASVCETGALRSDDRIEDAYAALALLARHPRVDPARVVLVGFSHGGGVVLLAASRSVSRGYTARAAPAFAAFVAFYPRCAGRYPGALAGPLRVHIGELDDWTPAPPCEVVVESLRGRGADARITVYRGARHAFDASHLPPERWLPNVQAPNRRRGATIGHHPDATRQARENLRRELAEIVQR